MLDVTDGGERRRTGARLARQVVVSGPTRATMVTHEGAELATSR